MGLPIALNYLTPVLPGPSSPNRDSNPGRQLNRPRSFPLSYRRPFHGDHHAKIATSSHSFANSVDDVSKKILPRTAGNIKNTPKAPSVIDETSKKKLTN
jgi:hypothetical protein